MSIKAASRVKNFRRITIVAAMAGLAVMSGGSTIMPSGRPTPTGLEVPRWITLKSNRVRARQGPGLDYNIMWEYRTAGMPVQVIAETTEWRKICDAEGSVAWIHRTVASGRRGVFNHSDEPVALHNSRSRTASVRALLNPRSLASLEECRDGWCRVRARKIKGWVPENTLFGTQTRTLCNANRPAGPGRVED